MCRTMRFMAAALLYAAAVVAAARPDEQSPAAAQLELDLREFVSAHPPLPLPSPLFFAARSQLSSPTCG